MDFHRNDRVGLLSPLEESSAEISRDSGIVSQSASSLSMVSEILSSGTVSQSPSFGAAAANVISHSPSLNEAAAGRDEQEEVGEENEVLRDTALSYSSYIRATAGEEVRTIGFVLRYLAIFFLVKYFTHHEASAFCSSRA